MSKIECCKHCVPPKRYPGCHSKCEEYLRERAEWDAMKETEWKNRLRDYTINGYDIAKMDRLRKKNK